MSGPRSRAALASCLLGALLGAPSCVSFEIDRTRVDEPVAEESVLALEPGVDDLGSCLAALGAPHFVREQPDGPVLLWGWQDAFGWGLSVSYSFLDRGPSASVSWDQTSDRTRGVALFFDNDLRLQRRRTGLLRDIAPVERRRPQVIE